MAARARVMVPPDTSSADVFGILQVVDDTGISGEIAGYAIHYRLPDLLDTSGRH
jgi:hypothetical protein